eukprot:COSAG01_NODE_1195_length_11304_cov_118.555823_6_plen_132_part_00
MQAELEAAEQLRQLHDSGLAGLLDRLYPKIKAGAEGFKDVDYALMDEAALQALEADDPWALSFLGTLRATLQPLVGSLNEANYDRVVLLAAAAIADWLWCVCGGGGVYWFPVPRGLHPLRPNRLRCGGVDE